MYPLERAMTGWADVQVERFGATRLHKIQANKIGNMEEGSNREKKDCYLDESSMNV